MAIVGVPSRAGRAWVGSVAGPAVAGSAEAGSMVVLAAADTVADAKPRLYSSNGLRKAR